MKKVQVLLTVLLCCFGALGISGCAKANTPSVEAEITKVWTTGSYDGTTLLAIDLNLKNNTDSNYYGAGLTYNTVATLDGQNLTSSFLSYDDPNALSDTASIAPGTEGKAQMVFSLPKTEGTVTLVTTVDNTDYSGNVEILNETIDLSTVEHVVSETDYDVAVNDVLVTDDGEGNNVIVLDVTFTNNSDKATSFGSAVKTELFQNDISLKTSYLPYNHPAKDDSLSSNTYADVKNGASIDAQIVYALNDTTHPVELKFIDSMSHDQAVILEKTIEVAGATAPADSQAA